MLRTEFCGVGLLSMQIYHASKLRACGGDMTCMRSYSCSAMHSEILLLLYAAAAAARHA